MNRIALIMFLFLVINSTSSCERVGDNIHKEMSIEKKMVSNDKMIATITIEVFNSKEGGDLISSETKEITGTPKQVNLLIDQYKQEVFKK